MKTESAILANGKVNVSLIEREIVHELGENAKYHAEDEMKKRAVHISECTPYELIQVSYKSGSFVFKNNRETYL